MGIAKLLVPLTVVVLALALFRLNNMWRYPADPPVTETWILAGQSNMAGRGDVEELPAYLQHPVNIVRLSADQAWVRAREPMHEDIDTKKKCGVGPGLEFAHQRALALPPGSVIRLVPTAIGGTYIREWIEERYNDLLSRCQFASSSGPLTGVLWYQGESDGQDLADAESYPQRIKELFTRLRRDLNQPHLPVLVVIPVADDEERFPYMSELRESIIASCQSHLMPIFCVDAVGSTFLPDKVHLDTTSQLRLGRVLAFRAQQEIPPGGF